MFGDWQNFYKKTIRLQSFAVTLICIHKIPDKIELESECLMQQNIGKYSETHTDCVDCVDFFAVTVSKDQDT